MKYLKIVFSSVAFLLFSYAAVAQQKKNYPGFNDEINKKIEIDSTAKLFVSAITINGNKKTKNYIILREMKFQAGDSIIAAKLFDLVQESRALIYNTSLFSQVEITPALTVTGSLAVNITVLEKFYIIPAPQFKLTDRNFNDWVKTYNADFNRVVYGIKFAHYNLSGRGDKLRIILLNGYARTVAFTYSSPYSNRALTEGFSLFGSFTQNRELSYKTAYDNTLEEFKKDGFSKTAFTFGGSYQRRRHFFWRTTYSISYNYIHVDDSVVTAAYNPHYFNSPESHVSYPDLQFSYQYSNTNNAYYPLTGKIYGFNILKRGLEFKGGVNMLSLDGSYALFVQHRKNWYSRIELFSKVKLPFDQPYVNQLALGYKDLYLRGQEYYVVDGVATALGKYTLRKKALSFDIPFQFMKIKKIPVIPVAFFAKAFTDVGYSYNKKEFDTRLGNRLLYTGGFGIDVLSLYDFTLNIEYSFNQLGQNGLFLHIRNGF
jgi:outer membrane protein assembly factor BamA